jgi:hypothetical protein
MRTKLHLLGVVLFLLLEAGAVQGQIQIGTIKGTV